jgi:PadR family transcriptional regulator PadR
LEGKGMSRDLSKGDIPTLVLAVLVNGPAHGYAIAREVERSSRDLLRLREGALYPALRVLETAGFIVGEWQEVDNAPARRVYNITHSGRGELAKRTRDWKQYVKAVNSLIGGNPDARTA